MSESANVNGGSPADAARVRKFKLRISLPGKDIRGEWLCQMTGSAMAYQSYVGAYGTPRVFTRHLEGDDMYLEDQDGHWLSYESTADCLYMSYKHNRVAWKLEGGRLIRKSDGHVASWQERQHWQFSTDHFIQAQAPSGAALTVAIVEIEATPIEKLIEKMTPVFGKRFAPLDGVDRYLFTVRSANGSTKPPERAAYGGHDVAFIALNQADADEHTVPVYVLQRTSAAEDRTYYKLSLQTEEAGYTLAAGFDGANFHAFPSSSDRAFLGQVYEHSAANPTAGESRYKYDFVAGPHDGWGGGTPVFKAITVKEAEKALIGSLGAESARSYATAWADVYGDKLVALLKGLGKQDMNADVMRQMHALFEGMPEPRYMTLGTGIHGGYGIGTTGIELGSIWRQEDFGHVPMHEPLASYSVEWITFGGATGLDLGASVDAVAIGTWYGDISQIEGACNGVTITLQAGVGLSVTLLWDGSWKGANFGPHPIGVTAIVAVGIEAGFGVFYNASATQFWNRRPDFPKM